MNRWNNRSCRTASTPGPVSTTSTRSSSRPLAPITTSASIITLPSAVNLIALLTRFEITCLSRVGSVVTVCGSGLGQRSSRSSPFSCAAGRKIDATSASSPCGDVGRCSTSILSASIFEISKMSLSRFSRCVAEFRIVLAHC